MSLNDQLYLENTWKQHTSLATQFFAAAILVEGTQSFHTHVEDILECQQEWFCLCAPCCRLMITLNCEEFGAAECVSPCCLTYFQVRLAWCRSRA